MIASDKAIFFADHINEGCSWHVAHGRLFLCRQNGKIWENALINQCTNFPEEECNDEEEIGSMANILWVEPENWKPSDLAPNCPQEEGMAIASIMLMSTRIGFDHPHVDAVWNMLLKECSGNTHREVLNNRKRDQE